MKTIVTPPRYRPLTRLACAILATSVAGCALKRDDYDVPSVDLPTSYLNKAAAAASGSLDPAAGTLPANPDPTAPAPTAETPQTPLAEVLPQWWRLFGSSELDHLIDRALRRNHDLQMATLRVAQERSRFGQAAADELPTVTAPLSASIDAPPNGLGTVAKGGEVVSERSYRLGLRADWRVDLWGERSAAAESARQRLWQSTFQRDNIQRAVISEVVSTYLQYLSLNDRYRVAQETASSQTVMLSSVEERYTEGEATGIELEQQKSTVRSSRANLPSLDLERAETRHRLALLVGLTPSDLHLSDLGLDSITLPAVVPGVPSALLLRRPDVRAAEADLLAADANIDEARARLLPTMDLSAGAGVGAHYMEGLFAPHNYLWNAIGTLTTTIFDYGKRQKQVDFTRARHQELVEGYIRTIYIAVRDVEDALAGIRFNALRLQAQADALDSSKTAWAFSQESYRVGATDYQTLLDTERTYRSDLDGLHRVRLQRYLSTVSLFRALGGGTGEDATLPGGGKRPTPPDLKNSGIVLAAAPAAVATKGVDWTQPDTLPAGWYITLSAVYDRAGVDAAARDLQDQLSGAADGLTIYPEKLGQVKGDTDEDRMAWYHLRISGLPDEARAKALCDLLGKDGRACTVDEE